MEEYTENLNINHIEKRFNNNNIRRLNYNGIRKNTRIPYNHEKQGGSFENRQKGSRYFRNDINDTNPQSKTVGNNTSPFYKGYRNLQVPERKLNTDRFFNESSEVNNYPYQRRNYGVNARGNYNHQDKSNYSNYYQRRPDYRNEFRGKYNNKKKQEKRIEPKESIDLNQRESLIWQLSHNKYECMICVSIIRSEAPTWSCDNCYHIFHVPCIEKWAKSGDNSAVRCPACQKQFILETSEARQKFSVYRCFCGKITNPEFKRGTIPHSCDEICGRSLAARHGFPQKQLLNIGWQEQEDASLGNGDISTEPTNTVLESSSQNDEFETECVNPQVNDGVEYDMISSLDDDDDMIETSHSSVEVLSVRELVLDSVKDSMLPYAPILSDDCDKDIVLEDVPCDDETTPQQYLKLPESTEMQQQHVLTNDFVIEESVITSANDTIISRNEMNSVNNSVSPQEWKCPHSCTILCHPGPCPPCEALVTRTCQCTRTRITTKCIVDERSLVCGSRCGRLLNCKRHMCMEECHAGPCKTCSVRYLERCWCDAQTSRETVCDAGQLEISGTETRYSCGTVCSRTLSCGQHLCSSPCHEGACKPCTDLPQIKERCWCGRVTISSLRDGIERSSCIDPRPSCGGSCGRALLRCVHTCVSQCHPGPCPPCQTVVEDAHCRCGRSMLPAMACCVATDAPDSLLCSRVCGKRLTCGRHQCRDRCCTIFNNEQHECMLACGRTLSCGLHTCERQCGHPGHCPTCQNVSFEELSCHCGTEISLPPIACGQIPPTCSRNCSRPQLCEHPVRHNCHPDSELPCPPCTVLTSKQCPGQHRVYHNVPCFRPVATCGLPCGQLLPRCEHRCIRLCHSGPCQSDDDTDDNNSSKCTQLCSRQRPGCGHPCGARCHSGECSPHQAPCVFMVQLHCVCKVRAVKISCLKLSNTVALIKSNSSADLKRDNLELILSSDGNVSLICDAECRKVFRDIKLVEAFDLSITSSNLNTYYSESIKKYAMNNIEFLVTTEKLLMNLLKNSKSATELVCSHTVRNLTDDKIDFISRYSSCFKASSKPGIDKDHKRYITIEVNRANSHSPKPLLSELLKTECPHLFPSKPVEEKSTRTDSTALTMSFADRIRLLKKD